MVVQSPFITSGSPSFDALVDKIRRFRSTIPPHVRVVAVTKYTEVWAMRAAYAAGIRDFGENRVPDATQKQVQLQDLTDVTWHLIGHLQSNKALKAVQIFDWIQSIDSLALAQRLDRLVTDKLAAKQLELSAASSAVSSPALNSCIAKKKPTICLQVKLLPDPNKSGWTVPELLADIPLLLTIEALDIQGLMVIPPAGLTLQASEIYFKQANDLATQLASHGLTMAVRSMGMSDDYQIAIDQGSTLIRPGRLLFG